MQRKIVYGIVVALLMIGIVGAPAQDRSDVGRALEDQGFEVLEEFTDSGVPSWRLRDSQDREFSVSVMGRFTEAHADALSAMREVIYEIDGLEIDRLRYVFEPDRADAVVIPEAFTISGEEYLEYLPSGMQFEFDDAVRYDFRLLVDNLAVRMNGQFVSEEQFLDRIERAVENPANYIQSQDPQFLAQQIVDLRERMEERVAVDTEQNNRDQEILSRVEDLRQETEAGLAEITSQGEQALERIEAEIETQVTELSEQQAALMAEMSEEFEAQLQTVREEKTALEREFEALRQGSIILASRTLFGNLRDVSPEAIVEVVQLRAGDPQLTQDEVRERVNGALPEDAEPLHGKHIQAIYALYFNQYE
ncbi:MAG: hypothetical protein ACOCYB_00140 [Alkalispirochaeta sp.]